MEQKKLFLLDAYALIFRAYYALIRAPRFSSSGFNTSAIFGFVNTLQEILNKENPTHIAVCFDPPGKTFRHEEYEKYKAEREETPEDIKKSVPIIKEIIKAYNIPIIEVAGFEADDVIGTLAHKAEQRGFITYMMTPDKDFGQLVTDKILVWKPSNRGDDAEIRGVKEICDKYQLQSPRQVIDLLALMGDKIDNIPGCPGVGEVTAVKLIKQFGSVENMLEHTDEIKGALRAKVENNAENIRFSKFLATICTDVPVEFNEKDLMREELNAPELRAIFEKLEFRTLISRILEPKKVEPVVAPQPTLFDFAAQESQETEAIATSHSSIATTNPDYHILENADSIDLFLNEVSALKEFSFALITDSDNAMQTRALGVAIATEKHKAHFIPLKNPDFIEKIKRIFHNDSLIKVGNNVKFDMIVLRRAGIMMSSPYFDTGVAHYLIQPEQNHGYSRLAQIELKYDAMNIDDIFDKKGRVKPEATAETVVNFACEQADIAFQLRNPLLKKIDENGMRKLLDDIEMPLLEVLAHMEYTGVRVDVPTLNEISRTLTSQMHTIEQEIYSLAGEEFNVGSPMKVGEILFDKLKLDDKAKKTKSGQYSTTEDILAKLSDRHPIVSKILDLRGIKKLLTTYVNALPELIDPSDGRIHTTYNQTVTATGRISSTNPNLQNIPIRDDEGREIRKAFIPAEGNLFYSADYSQIELRLVADLSKDEAMVNSFLAGEDIHRSTAAKIYHETIDDVTDTQRRHAKTANFGILYGISAFGLAERLRIPRSEAKMLIDGYLSTYPAVHDYMNKSIEVARQQGYVTTQFGRRRMLPEINSRNAVVRSYSERNAINAPIQGTAADIIKLAMVRIFRRFHAEGLKSKMIMQVHDELNFDVVPSELQRVNEIVTTEMAGAYSSSVPLIASAGRGANWLEAH